MRRLTVLVLAGMLFCSAGFGCSWAGRTTGKVVNKVEQGSESFEKSYEKERKKAQ